MVGSLNMQITLQKTSNTHHLLTCERADGTAVSSELETKSFLVHDFTHLAYEEVMNVQEGFWGSVASGEDFETLRTHEFDPGSVLWQAEMVVGPLQSVMQGKHTVEGLLTALTSLFEAHEEAMPGLTVERVATMQERFRALMGEWNSLALGEEMMIKW